MRKTTSDDSRSAYAAEDAGYGGAPRRQRGEAGARRSRFDDFDEEFLAPREQPELERAPAGRRVNRASRGRRDDDSTRLQRMWGSAFGRCCLGAAALTVLAALGFGGWTAREFLRSNPLFLVASSAQIQVEGNRQVSADDVRDVFGEDIGRNLFFIPISTRRKQMEALPWVERASVERLLPNQIRVRVVERVPVAFAKDAGKIMLVDRHGVLLVPPSGDGAAHYSFPVLDGISGDMPQSTRQARMNEYLGFLQAVDSHGEQVSSQLSEVDVSDPEDIEAVVADGSGNGVGALTIHFGDENFYERYRMYQAHLAEWQQQVPGLGKIDLRDAPQVVLGKAEQEAEAAPAAAAPVAAPVATQTASVDRAVAPPFKPASAPGKSSTAKSSPSEGHPSASLRAGSFSRAVQPAILKGALAPGGSAPRTAALVSAKTSAGKPVAVANKPVTHPVSAHVVAAKSQMKAKPATAKSASLLRTKAEPNKTVPRKLSQAEIAALNHPAAPSPAPSPAMQAFLTESPKPASATPRSVTRVQTQTPAAAARVPSATAPKPVQQQPPPRLIIHPGFNSSGGQP